MEDMKNWAVVEYGPDAYGANAFKYGVNENTAKHKVVLWGERIPEGESNVIDALMQKITEIQPKQIVFVMSPSYDKNNSTFSAKPFHLSEKLNKCFAEKSISYQIVYSVNIAYYADYKPQDDITWFKYFEDHDANNVKDQYKICDAGNLQKVFPELGEIPVHALPVEVKSPTKGGGNQKGNTLGINQRVVVILHLVPLPLLLVLLSVFLIKSKNGLMMVIYQGKRLKT